MSKVRLQFPESLGLLGLLGLVGVIGHVINSSVLKPWLALFAAFSLIGLQFFNRPSLQYPERLGLLSFFGFLGFLGYIPGGEFLKGLYGLFGFGFFFAFLGRSKQSNQ